MTEKLWSLILQENFWKILMVIYLNLLIKQGLVQKRNYSRWQNTNTMYVNFFSIMIIYILLTTLRIE